MVITPMSMADDERMTEPYLVSLAAVAGNTPRIPGTRPCSLVSVSTHRRSIKLKVRFFATSVWTNNNFNSVACCPL